MISLEQAWQLIDESVASLDSITIETNHAAGYILATDIISPVNVKPFRSSQMDGFALKSEWLANCSNDNPVALPIATTRFAGDSSPVETLDKKVIKIMTGAIVPDEFDAVVKFEDTTFTDDEVMFTRSIQPATNIIQEAEDVKAGDLIMSAGDLIYPFHIGLISSIGLTTLKVVAMPLALVISIGDELQLAGETLGTGKLFDANLPAITSMLTPHCIKVDSLPPLHDNREQLQEVLNSEHDLIVTSGGVSAGEKDYVADAARDTGWSILFHGVSIKPGKPVLMARRDRQILFGLPGNPLSANVTCAMLVLPAVRKMSGWSEFVPSCMSCQLESPPRYRGSRTLIWPVQIVETGNRRIASLCPEKSSASLTSLLQSDGLAIIQASKTPSETVSASVIRWNDLL